jgi:CheY-like chemotaxis protein
MPEGGALVINVDNVRRGNEDFVHMAIRDTGEGMTDDVKGRAFEPFFSTKGVGKGTGLGLSMVYGFAKQSGGDIDIDSVVGQGTTVHIFLPRTDEHAAAKKTAPVATIAGGSETVLVVDDEADILENVATILSEFGYHILTASSADAALAMLSEEDRIDLLFTDVIMPGVVSANELAAQARELHPEIRVLFTSGYTENAMIHNGRLDDGVNLLSKPYGRADLASAVRTLLSSSDNTRATAEV